MHIINDQPLDAPAMALDASYAPHEQEAVLAMLAQLNWSNGLSQRVEVLAKPCIEHIQQSLGKHAPMTALMAQYDLSNAEGVALMCLAEALARTPDAAMRQKLIADKLVSANWQQHRGASASWFVNAATWGLAITGKFLDEPSHQYLASLKSLVQRMGGPVLRGVIAHMMQVLGQHFVMGETIADALKRAQKKEQLGYGYSFDMLGEAAHTEQDADKYMAAYQAAIVAVGKAAKGRDRWQAAGVSVKLSALSPRYAWSQREYCVPELIERLKQLAIHAKQYGVILTVDAEEADRLSMSLEIILSVYRDSALRGWGGLGLAIQAYQKRALAALDQVIACVTSHQEDLHVRLVKGAYWDSEIKHAQVEGHPGYPVWTRKTSTDVNYLACAQKLLQANACIYPQFATHNAYTAAAVLAMCPEGRSFEFQCLHGMGTDLYDHMMRDHHTRCRIYAPVGAHQELLPYLVRRLLENGANSSFVNQLSQSSVDALLCDPVAKLLALEDLAHPRLPLPVSLYGATRCNAMGVNWADTVALSSWLDALAPHVSQQWSALSAGVGGKPSEPLKSPADSHDTVGYYQLADVDHIDGVLNKAHTASNAWALVPLQDRCQCLLAMADLLEKHGAECVALLIREAGKTLPDAHNELREAVDFCRYYAQQASTSLQTKTLPGPTGESNQLSYHGRGVILCISPWNFPLAIFCGQVVAALVAGNTVVAKPAEQTPLIAAKVVFLLHQAGVPEDACVLLLGEGSLLGPVLCRDVRVQGVLFTGSTDAAQNINRCLAERKDAIVPLVAETGGQNAMVVDSTALPEQVVRDVLVSAFGSVGQRCSALRVLYIQDDIYDRVVTMLQGAMALLRVGSPLDIATDVGPVIDEDALRMLHAHETMLKQQATCIAKAPLPSVPLPPGHFFAPCAYEIPSIAMLSKEVFGPILHVVRFTSDKFEQVISDINTCGYGLTFGMHSRIAAQAQSLTDQVVAGNIYVNRNMVGAVVGVQPFGGQALSGTGPKAGGPHYLHRLCVERALCVDTTAAGGNATLMAHLDDVADPTEPTEPTEPGS